jgi:hypothetical protein
LVFYAALEKPELLRKHYRPRLAAFQELLGEHMKKRIENGALRDVDPTLMGRALIGIIAYHQIVCQLLGGADFPGCHEGVAETYTDIWLRGTLPREAEIRQSPLQPPISKALPVLVRP